MAILLEWVMPQGYLNEGSVPRYWMSPGGAYINEVAHEGAGTLYYTYLHQQAM